MDVALLNRKITVQKNTVVTDAIGNHTNEWADFYSCYATISGESPSESTSAGTVVDNTKADFTVRWCKAVSEINSDRKSTRLNSSHHTKSRMPSSA